MFVTLTYSCLLYTSLSHQRGARCAFAYLTVSAAVRERHIQVGVTVQYLLAVEMTVAVSYTHLLLPMRLSASEMFFS